MIFDGIIDDLGKLQKSKPTLRIVGTEELAKLKSKQIEYSKNIFCEESGDFKTFLERHSVSSEVTDNIISQGQLIAPTKVQSQVIPKLLERQNIICSAPTGSGKTLAYSLPIVELILRNELFHSKQNSLEHSDDVERFCEPRALIITHMPMLVEQIQCEVEKISCATPIMVQKANDLMNDPNLPLSDILIGTPKDILRFQHSFDHVEYIVVDECDQLFENAKISHYKEQISKILRRCTNPQLSHAFFSATFSPKLEKWAQSYFNDPQCIYIGQKNLTNCFVEQSLRFTGSEYGKILELKKLIRQSNTELIPLIIFVQSKPRALDCVVELQREFPTLKTAAIYSSRKRKDDHQENQSEATFQASSSAGGSGSNSGENEERSRVCDQFRSGTLDILVATNCLSRGMDFPLLKSVINFDIPTSEKDYIHRVGRASRGGKIGGKSITFFTTSDHPYLYGIAKQIMASGGTIPQYLETLLMGKEEEDSENSKSVVVVVNPSSSSSSSSSACRNMSQNVAKQATRKLAKNSKSYSTIAKQIRRNTKRGIPRRKPFQLPDTVKFI